MKNKNFFNEAELKQKLKTQKEKIMELEEDLKKLNYKIIITNEPEIPQINLQPLEADPGLEEKVKIKIEEIEEVMKNIDPKFSKGEQISTLKDNINVLLNIQKKVFDLLIKLHTLFDHYSLKGPLEIHEMYTLFQELLEEIKTKSLSIEKLLEIKSKREEENQSLRKELDILKNQIIVFLNLESERSSSSSSI